MMRAPQRLEMFKVYVLLVVVNVYQLQESYAFVDQPTTKLARKLPFGIFIESGTNIVCRGIAISPIHVLVHFRCEVDTAITISPVTASVRNDFIRNEIVWFQTRNNMKIIEVETRMPVLSNNVTLYIPINPLPLLVGQSLTIIRKNRTEVRKMPPVITLYRRKIINPNFNNQICIFEETFLCPGNRFGYLLLSEHSGRQVLTFVRRSVYSCRPRYPSGCVNIASFLSWMTDAVGYQPETLPVELTR